MKQTNLKQKNLKQANRSSTKIWKRFVALGALSALAAMIVVSCSDDNPVGTNKAVGSSSDSSFQLVSNQLSPSGTDPIGINWIDSLMVALPGFTAPSSNGSVQRLVSRGGTQSSDPVVVVDSFRIDSASGWITFNATITEGTDTFTVVDSMRFRDLLNNSVIPSDSLNLDSLGGVDIRVHATASVTDTTDFTGTGIINSSITIDIIGRDSLSQDTIRINASEIDSLVGVVNDSLNGQCSITVSFSSTLTNIVGLIDDTTSECPISGSARISATVDADCSAGQGTLMFNDTWTVTATFNGGVSATVVFENSTTRWEVTEPCGDNPPAASSFDRLTSIAKASVE